MVKIESFNIEDQELKNAYHKKADELGISRSQFIRDSIQMKLNYIEDLIMLIMVLQWPMEVL